jgi:hypothetical protein
MSNFRLEDEFIPRTKKNLELVLEHNDLGFHEVTQLMNSMIGLLIFPKEVFFNRIRRLSLDEFEEQHWPKPNIVSWEGISNDDPSFSEGKIYLRRIITKLRNSISHATFKFESTSDEIEEVIFIDEDPDNVTNRTKLKFGIDDFKEFALRFADEMLFACNIKRKSE